MPRPKYEYTIRDSKGTHAASTPDPRNSLQKPKHERAKHVIKKPIAVKTKRERWTTRALINFFRLNDIHANRPNGWFVSFQSPYRKMTVEDQLDLFMQPDLTAHFLNISEDRKHLIIDTLAGDDE